MNQLMTFKDGWKLAQEIRDLLIEIRDLLKERKTDGRVEQQSTD